MENQRIVIDTTLFIEHLRSKDKSKTTLFKLSSTGLRYVSSVTVYELFAGATDASKMASVRYELQGLLILPFTTEIAEKAGEIFRDLRSRGQMIEATDIFIAATALVDNLPVKTVNIRHFSRVQGLLLA
ncbi:MAG: type II toxin-antitoxin system VapC family toxin [Saprospiraceae bacterium]|nr:type II toxin-antitoxin system VapC family toxin [Saprospiraceae bacterium]